MCVSGDDAMGRYSIITRVAVTKILNIFWEFALLNVSLTQSLTNGALGSIGVYGIERLNDIERPSPPTPTIIYTRYLDDATSLFESQWVSFKKCGNK